MKISDRFIGYLTILTLICIFAMTSYEMFEAHQEVSDTALVDFNELGTLQPEDVVVVRGYRVGSIGKVTWLGDRSRVQIKFDSPMTIREGTQFNNVNYALMGQRRLEIIPSKTGKVLPKDHIHQGTFEPGIAEALRYMEDVNRQITYVRETVLLIVNGDSAHTSAQEKYEQIMSGIEQILENTDKTISVVQPKIKDVFNQIEGASNTLIDITQQADTAVKTVTSAVNEKIESAENIVKTLAEGTEKAKQVINDIESAPMMQKLTQSREAVDKLAELVDKMSKLIAAIDTKNLKMYDDNGKEVELVTWKNVNLIGKTAREKAKIRAEKGESLPENKPADSSAE